MHMLHLGAAVFSILGFLGLNKYIFNPPLVPWNIVIGVGVLSGVAIVLFFFGDRIWEAINDVEAESWFSGGNSGDDYEMAIDPVEAPHFINETIEEKRNNEKTIPGRPLQLDHTHSDNEDFHQFTRPSPRFEKMMCGVVGRPKDGKFGETVAYVVDLSGPSIWDYSGNVHDSEGRLDPFDGKYDYLFKKQYDQVAAEEVDGRRTGGIVQVHTDGPRSRDNGGRNQK